MEDLLEPKRDVTPRPGGCARVFRGCAVIAVLMVLALIALLIYGVRMPSVRALAICQNNMLAVDAALDRYNDVHGEYPPDLNALRKDYLKDLCVLRCPLDHSKNDEPSYIYHRPGPSASGDFIVLECVRHRLYPGLPVSRLQITKDGSPKLITPMPREPKTAKPLR